MSAYRVSVFRKLCGVNSCRPADLKAARITADPPIHTWTRRMLLPAFAPRAVEAHRQFTEELCHSLIDGFSRKILA